MRATKVLSVSLPPEMLTWAEEVARSEHRTVNELVREALRAYKALRLDTKPPSNLKLTTRTAKSSR